MKHRVNYLINIVKTLVLIAGIVLLSVGLSQSIKPLWITGAVILGLIAAYIIFEGFYKGYQKAKSEDVKDKNNSHPNDHDQYKK